MDELEIEHNNVRAALAWLIESGDVESAWRLGSAIWHVWFHRGHVLEARAWASNFTTLSATPVVQNLQSAEPYAAATTRTVAPTIRVHVSE